jgi:hypothetical protein
MSGKRTKSDTCDDAVPTLFFSVLPLSLKRTRRRAEGFCNLHNNASIFCNGLLVRVLLSPQEDLSDFLLIINKQFVQSHYIFSQNSLS